MNNTFMKFLLPLLIERIQNDKEEVCTEQRDEIIKKLKAVTCKREAAFILLDHNLPITFANTFAPGEETSSYLEEWMSNSVTCFLEPLKKKQKLSDRFVKSVLENCEQAHFDIMNLDSNTISSEEEALNILATIFNTNADDIMEQLGTYKDFAAKMFITESEIKIAQMNCDFAFDHYEKLIKTISSEWKKMI